MGKLIPYKFIDENIIELRSENEIKKEIDEIKDELNKINDILYMHRCSNPNLLTFMPAYGCGLNNCGSQVLKGKEVLIESIGDMPYWKQLLYLKEELKRAYDENPYLSLNYI